MVLTAALLAAAVGPPAVAGPIDAAAFYSGEWREQARTPSGLTKGCEWAITAYGRDDKGRVTVTEQRGKPGSFGCVMRLRPRMRQRPDGERRDRIEPHTTAGERDHFRPNAEQSHDVRREGDAARLGQRDGGARIAHRGTGEARGVRLGNGPTSNL